jgi:hypothetical protein
METEELHSSIHLPQVVLILKSALTLVAPMLSPVVLLVHMATCSREVPKETIARLAFDPRLPVAIKIHVVLTVGFVQVLLVTCLAFISRRPVVDGVHVLSTGLGGAETASAGLAFIHVFSDAMDTRGCWVVCWVCRWKGGSEEKVERK